MARECSVCGKKLGFFEGKITIADGVVCTSCWGGAGLDLGLLSICTASKKTVRQLKDMIEIEVLKVEAEKAGLRRKIAAGNSDVEESDCKKESANVLSKQAEASAARKPVDIILRVNDKKKVAFLCEGQPVINFDDLINGREMIIGDGFIENKSGIDLPDIDIACEFDPPIVDPGLIHYDAGTFVADEEGRFEIDDPPVNLEEYAKIKKTIKGKIKFTLFVGDEQIHTEECAMQVNPAPDEEMQRMMNVVMYEEEKNATGPVNVFLYARETGAFEVDCMRHPELLYSMYSNGREQLIGDVYVSNKSNKILKKVQFAANFTSDILSPVKVLLGDVPAGENISFEVDDPAINVDKLEMLTETETCIATYTLSVNGKVVAEATGRIAICPYNQWNGALVLLPAYMTPNHPNIISLLQNASKWMMDNSMSPSLEGYQGNSKRVEEMVRAVYHAIENENIIYSNPPVSFFGPQRIRLCEDVLEQKFATCMDMAILFASCLESFGLHPVLLTAPGHIFVGVWLNAKGRLSEPIMSDAKLIQKYIKEGKLIAIECTAMNMGKNTSYEESKKLANKTVELLVENEVSDNECIDVHITRAAGILPLPMRVHKKVASVSVPGAVPVKTEIEPPVSVKLKEIATEVVTYNKESYKVFDGDLSHISIDNFYDKQSKRVIKDAIAEIVAVEGPISQPDLIRALINTTSLGRASKQVTEHLDKLVATADVKITRQAGVRFLWNHGTDPSTYMTYRVKEQRSPEEICKYELKNAVCYLLQEKGPMTKEELTKAMVSMFGYNRMSKKIEEGTAMAIKAAREFKVIEQDEDKKFKLKA